MSTLTTPNNFLINQKAEIEQRLSNCKNIDTEAGAHEAANHFLALKNLQRIEAYNNALIRIANNTYGNCIHCHQSIGIERLTAIPETVICQECAKKNN